MREKTKEKFTGIGAPFARVKRFGRRLAGLLLIAALLASCLGCGIGVGNGPLPSDRETAPSQPAGSTTLPLTEAPASTAAPDPDSCGEGLSWSFDAETGLLRVEGSGAMRDFAAPEDAPWHPYRSQITALSLPEGLTRVGNHAFASCFSLSRVSLPEGLTQVGDCAFQWCSALSYVVFPESLAEIGASAFQGCELSSLPVTLPESVAVIGDHAFANCSGLEELRILGQDCAIGSTLASPSLTTVCGFPGSAAEQYAERGRYAFTPIVVTELDVVADWVAKDNEERGGLDGVWKEAFGGVTTIEGAGLVGGRRLAKLVRTVSLTISEEEFARAKQDRLIVLQGETFSYRDTQEQFELTFGTSIPYTVKEDGFIFYQNGGRMIYDVSRVGDSYVFAYDWGDSWSRLEEVTDVAWVLLDESTVWTFGGEEAFLWTVTELWPFMHNTIHEIRIGTDGTVQIDCAEKDKN